MGGMFGGGPSLPPQAPEPEVPTIEEAEKAANEKQARTRRARAAAQRNILTSPLGVVEGDTSRRALLG